MTTQSRKRTTIELNPGDKAKLQAIAKQLGFVNDRGREKGHGSISALMQAIAEGKIKLQAAESGERNDKDLLPHTSK